MPRITGSINGVFSVVIASVFWGTTGTAASLIPDVSALAIGAFAMGGGGLLLVCNARYHLQLDGKALLAQPKLLALGALAVAIYPLAFYSAMALSGVALGTLIAIASGPLFSVLLEHFSGKSVITWRWFISFVLGAFGVVLLTLAKDDHVHSGEHVIMGLGLSLLAGLTYALYSWSARQLIERGVSAKSAMASLFGLACVLLLPSLLVTANHMFADARHITVLLYMAGVPMFLGYLCFGYGLQRINASQATLITLLEPVIATLLAVFIVGERFASLGWYGITLIILCCLLQVIKPCWWRKVANILLFNK